MAYNLTAEQLAAFHTARQTAKDGFISLVTAYDDGSVGSMSWGDTAEERNEARHDFEWTTGIFAPVATKLVNAALYMPTNGQRGFRTDASFGPALDTNRTV